MSMNYHSKLQTNHIFFKLKLLESEFVRGKALVLQNLIF